MDKLYPPVIEGTIPAFYGTTLVVPFSMNRAVGKNDISALSLKIKTIQTNTFIANIKSFSHDTTQAKFDVSEVNLTPGQYYKLQLAYISTNKVLGYYSTVGVIKYYGPTGPQIYIDGLSSKKSNLFTGSYIGIFEHQTEPMEKVAQYCFTITTSDGQPVYDTGWLIHNTINDVNSLSSNDTFKYTDELDVNQSYYLQYRVMTSNNMLCETPKYKVLQRDSIGTDLNLELTAETNYENGYMAIRLKSLGIAGENATLTGAFEISRQNIKNPRHWEIIFVFILQNEVATKTVWRDFTVKHGETYRYAIRQFNEMGVYTDRVLSNEVFCDFEDAFLFDGKRQLKIKYNPKVSSFKNDIPESKTDTIGSKYPFIFRNGYVNYKEFPISGLISYWSDEEEFFLTNQELGIKDITNWTRNETPNEEELPENFKTTNLTNYNIAAERKFKLEVLEWLTNGKPKLFRSPTEGNYIVRLLNTSLSPTDTLGRMLHTFQSTAYEIADNIYENLVGCGFIKNSLDENEKLKKYYRTVPLGYQGHEQDEEKYIPIITGRNPNYLMDNFGYIELLKNPKNPDQILHADKIYFDDMVSNDVIWINDQKIIIGNTGQYILEKTEFVNSVKIRAIPGYDKDGNWVSKQKAESDIAQWIKNVQNEKDSRYAEKENEINLLPITSEDKANRKAAFLNELEIEYRPILADIYYTQPYDDNFLLNDYEGLFTYSYIDDYANSFDLIVGQKLIDYPCRQFIGDDVTRNVLKDITDIRTELVGILQIQAELKQLENIYTWADIGILSEQDGFTLNNEDVNYYGNFFSLDKVKSPDNNIGNSWDELHGKTFLPQANALYIYKINSIFRHQEPIDGFDRHIPHNYIETLSPWEIKELKEQVIEMLDKYNVPFNDLVKFIRYETTGDEKYIIYDTIDSEEPKSLKEMLKIIKLHPNDYILLEKYFGKEEFNYANTGEDPHDTHVDMIWVYKTVAPDELMEGETEDLIGKKAWRLKPVLYHINEGYYVDATYYDGANYHEYNKYYKFSNDGDYYLIYKDDKFKVVQNYCPYLYINTGITEGAYKNRNGDLCAPNGEVLQPYLDLSVSNTFKTTLIPDITDIYVGDAAILNLSYQAREIEYNMESTNTKLKELKKDWQDLVNSYLALYYTRKTDTKADEYDFKDKDWADNFEGQQAEAEIYVNNIKIKYAEYVNYLTQKINEYKEEHGLV